MDSQAVLRGLINVWGDFSTKVDKVPIIDKLNRGKFRLEDYQQLLRNHRQQVIEGGRWISLAASSIQAPYFDIRSAFIRHAATEHQDFNMLEDNYESVGGNRHDIQNTDKNIGTEALNAFMFHRASQPNPFDLLGAMFIIEGLGQNKAGEWAKAIQQQLQLEEKQVSFLAYHGQNDEDHMDQFYAMLETGILNIPNMGNNIIKTAKITARLYLLQLEEMDNV